MIIRNARCNSDDLKSVCRIQNKLTKRPPTELKATQTTPNLKPVLNNTGKNKKAKIIEPDTEASTWALGSHK